MSDFTSQFDDSLLSAYVDGELTPTEYARVEAHLSEHAEARQLVEELRAMADAVHGLPKASLASDLSAAVLERLQQTVDSKPVVLQRGGAHGHASGYGRLTRWQWSMAAIAAVLLVALFIPRHWAPDPVVDNDHSPGTDTREDEPLVADPASGDVGGTRPDSEMADGGFGGGGLGGTFDSPEPGSAPAPDVLADIPPPGSAVSPMRGAGGTFGGSVTESAPVDGARPPLAEDTSERDPFAVRPAMAGGRNLRELMTHPVETIPLVVGVETTRAVLERKSFDRILGGNGIVVEETPFDEYGDADFDHAAFGFGLAASNTDAFSPVEEAAAGEGEAGRERRSDGAETRSGIEANGAEGLAAGNTAASEVASDETARESDAVPPVAGALATEAIPPAPATPSELAANAYRVQTETAAVDEAILVEMSPEQLVKTLDDLSDNMSVYNSIEIDVTNASEPLKTQSKQQQYKFNSGAELKGWVRSNEDVLKQEAFNQREIERQNSYGKAATDDEAADNKEVGKPEVAQRDESVDPKPVDQQIVKQQARAQVLYSNNMNRAGGYYQQYGGNLQNSLPADPQEENSAQPGEGSQQILGGRGMAGQANAEADARGQLMQRQAAQRGPTKDELAKLAERAVTVSRAASAAADSAAAGVPKMRVLFLLKVNDLPEPAAAAEEAVRE